MDDGDSNGFVLRVVENHLRLMKQILDLDLKLETTSDVEPINRFIRIVFYQCVHDQCSEIVMEFAPEGKLEPWVQYDTPDTLLDIELVHPLENFHSLADKLFWERKGKFTIRYLTQEGWQSMAEPPGYFYQPVALALLAAADVPYWKRGSVQGEIWVENPQTTFLLTTADPIRSLRFTRVENRNAPATLPWEDDSSQQAPCMRDERWLVYSIRQLPEWQSASKVNADNLPSKLDCVKQVSVPGQLRLVSLALAVLAVFLVGFLAGMAAWPRSMAMALAVGFMGAGVTGLLLWSTHLQSIRPKLAKLLGTGS